ncbi:unnamed protein product [Brassicogethes aeneus]|uniref:C2H2-type domain-containing protein n=1 Tax=Brassicogethes aeneus TaxID=1431903 RepID=A0A9P0BJD1_BRAAE|nr:unnamed protein product [Brassicogethes aeneus]
MWSQNLCRTCGQISETCHPIYDVDSSGVIEQKIKSALQLNIDDSDRKPKQICNTCLAKLNDLIDFINLAQVTNLKFDSIYSSSLKKISNLWTSDLLSGLQQENTMNGGTIILNSTKSLENPTPSLTNFKESSQTTVPSQKYQEYEQKCNPINITKSVLSQTNEENNYDLTFESVCNSLRFSSLNLQTKENYFCNNYKQYQPQMFNNLYGLKKKLKVEPNEIKKKPDVNALEKSKKSTSLQTCRNSLNDCKLCGKKFESKKQLLNHEGAHLREIFRVGFNKKRALMKKSLTSKLKTNVK